MAKIDPQDVFKVGEAFLSALKILTNAINSGSGVVITMVMATNSAFTLEMFLKCLVLVENHHYRSGHDLYKLFKCLSLTTQTELTKVHDELIAASPEFIAEATRLNHPIDLETLLILGSNAFVEFRYPHEKPTKKHVWALNKFIFCVRERILVAKPEWNSLRLIE